MSGSRRSVFRRSHHPRRGRAHPDRRAGGCPAGAGEEPRPRARARARDLIAAGFVDTPLSASILGDALEARREQLCETLPVGRLVGPADVAELAVHLMVNRAITGATFDIDGGRHLVEG